jgi:uncharacterized iron-regulated membrane protein
VALPRITLERLVLAALMVVMLASGLSWLQRRFDTRDVEKGIARALGHRARPGGPAVLDALLALGEGDPRCDGEVVSVLFGDVRVICRTPRRPAADYRFRVLLDGRRPPKAETPEARALLDGLESR